MLLLLLKELGVILLHLLESLHVDLDHLAGTPDRKLKAITCSNNLGKLYILLDFLRLLVVCLVLIEIHDREAHGSGPL